MSVTNTGYDKALNAVIKVRKHRQKIYGDTWKDAKEYELVAMLKQKVGRLEHQFVTKKLNNYEKAEDNLIDLVNYALFLLENLMGRSK